VSEISINVAFLRSAGRLHNYAEGGSEANKWPDGDPATQQCAAGADVLSRGETQKSPGPRVRRGTETSCKGKGATTSADKGRFCGYKILLGTAVALLEMGLCWAAMDTLSCSDLRVVIPTPQGRA